MTPEDAYRKVWAEARAAIDHLPELKTFLPSLPQTPRFNPQTEINPAAPGVDFNPCLTQTSEAFHPLIETLIEVKQSLNWLQTYTEADGVDAHFLGRYGYIHLSGPDAPLEASDHRLFLIYLGAASYYPDHRHLPEEVYGIIAGEGVFTAEGRPARRVRAGDCVRHHSNQIHATDMQPGPLVALVGWRADDLTVDPKIVA